MPAARKPKKVFIQFAIALVVAIIFGVVALGVGFVVIQGISKNAASVQEEADKKSADAQAEQERYQKMLKQLQQQPKSYKVVQALADLNPGQPITKDMVTLVEITDRPTPGSLTMISQALGKVVKTPILSGEPLDNSKLIDTGGFINVEEGKRAIAIQVDGIGGLNGALSPGAHVDILITVTRDGGTITKTLLQNVPVVSVGNSGGAAPSAAGPGPASGMAKSASGGAGLAVTLIVTPKQAELLTLAGQLGGFHLTLRSYSDKQIPVLTGADLTALMTGVQPAGLKQNLPAPPRLPAGEKGFHNVNYSPDGNLPDPSATGRDKSTFTMQIYRGTGSETVDFEK